MTHKFKIKQQVRLVRAGFSDSHAMGGTHYEITRLMPADNSGEYSYRIKAQGSAERAVRESDIIADSVVKA